MVNHPTRPAPGALALALAFAVALGACAPRVEIRPRGRGAAVFLYEGRADEVRLVGTMTGWRAVPLERSGDRFHLSLALPDGRYEYRLQVYRGESLHEVLPEHAERVSDGFGGENAILRIP